MKISWKWLSEFVDLSVAGTPGRLAEILTMRGLEVEEIQSLSDGFDKVIIAQILERVPHPQADRLSLCKVTMGSGEPLEIVCGAQNMKALDKVALAQIGAHLPNGLKIEQSKIRGIVSNGMLCSEEELKIKEKAEGILILSPEAPLGIPLAKFLGRDDTILTFKLTPNRGDCLSHFGMAREIAAALQVELKEPSFSKLSKPSLDSFSIQLAAGDSAPQFLGCFIEGVKVGPSPKGVVDRLESLGFRSINNVVDATNLLMLELGHPMHAYDADRLQGKTIQVRFARQGEKLPLLDGSTRTLDGFELVIADGVTKDSTRAIGLAGVMGGGNSEVEAGTQRIFLECAEFAPHLVRRAAARHQLKTEASHRFERGVDPKGLERAISRLAQKIVELAGGEVKAVLINQVEEGRSPKEIRLSSAWINQFLGTSLNADLILKILKNQGCQVSENPTGEWSVIPPSHRLDLVIREDLAEEVARGIGYDSIPSTVPILTSQPTVIGGVSTHSNWLKIEQAKDALTQCGLMETVNYSFTSQRWLSEFGMQSNTKLMNPMSEEFEVLVPSLIPSLVKNALDNERHRFGSEELPLRLFEVRPVFESSGEIKAQGELETGVKESWKVAWLLAGPRHAKALRMEQGQVDFFDLKAISESFFDLIGTRGVRFQSLSQVEYLHPGQSVEILVGQAKAGVMGLLHPRIQKNLKMRAPLWVAEIDWGVLQKVTLQINEARALKPWPEFPTMERDFALLVKKEVRAEQITQLALKAGKPIAKVAKIFDIYQGSQVVEGMTSVAVRVIFFDEKRSLQETETEAASSKILESWKKELGAQLRS